LIHYTADTSQQAGIGLGVRSSLDNDALNLEFHHHWPQVASLVFLLLAIAVCGPWWYCQQAGTHRRGGKAIMRSADAEESVEAARKLQAQRRGPFAAVPALPASRAAPPQRKGAKLASDAAAAAAAVAQDDDRDDEDDSENADANVDADKYAPVIVASPLAAMRTGTTRRNG
jgi:hypothetical protein